jgi:nucleotide-binding universal stress UspA family protein
MIKRILLPFDFSSCAEQALRAALFLSEKTGAELFILHILNGIGSAEIIVREGDIVVANVEGTKKDEIALIAESVADNIRKMVDRHGFPDSKWQTIIESGNIAAKIIQIAEKMRCDFIVMGTQGDADYENLVIGSNTQKVTRNAPCPMLMVRNFKEENHFKNIALAVDFETANKSSVDYVVKFAQTMRAKLTLMYINTPLYFISERESQERFRSFIEKYQLSGTETKLYCDLHEDEGIVHCAHDLSANLIVLVTNKRKGLSRILSGSVSEEVITESLMPVLVLPPDFA